MLVNMLGLQHNRQKFVGGAGGGTVNPEPPGEDPLSLWEMETIIQGANENQRAFHVSNYNPGPGDPATARLANGLGGPYPLIVPVSGFTGTVSDLIIDCNFISSLGIPGVGDDFGLLIVGPTGVKVKLISDCGNALKLSGNGRWHHPTGLPILDVAVPGVNRWQTSVAIANYRPTAGASNVGSACPANFYAPAPAGPYSSSLLSFLGTDPNGNWEIYAIDDTNTVHPSFRLGSRNLVNPSPFTLTIAAAGVSFIQNPVNGINLLLSGSISQPITSGRIGGAVQLTGSEALYVPEPQSNIFSITPGAPDFAEPRPRSIIFWYRPASINVSQPGVMMDFGYACYLQANNKFKAIYDTDADAVEYSAVTAVAGEWHMVAFGWSPNETDPSRRGWISVNGGAKVFGASIGTPSPATGPLSVGNYSGAGFSVGNSNGAFDELNVFGYEVSDNNLKFLWNDGNGRRFPWVARMGLLQDDTSSDGRLMASPGHPLVGP